MGLSTNTTVYSGGDQVFPINFALGFLSRDDIEVRVNQEELDGLPLYRDFEWIDDSNIRVTSDLTVGDVVTVQRTVSKMNLDVKFTDMYNNVTKENLDRQSKQAIMIYHEILDGRTDNLEDIVATISEGVVAQVADGVSYEEAQNKTPAQQKQARDNINASAIFNEFNTKADVLANTVDGEYVTLNYWDSNSEFFPTRYKRVDTEPNHEGKMQDASGAWFEILLNGYPGGPSIDVRSVGAVNDSTPTVAGTDSQPAFSRAMAISAALGGSAFYIGQYDVFERIINGTVNNFEGTPDGTSLIGVKGKSILYHSGDNELFLVHSAGRVVDRDVAPQLTVSSGAMTSSLTVDDTSSLSKGDWIAIESSDQFDTNPLTGFSYVRSELHRIREVLDDTTISLEGLLGLNFNIDTYVRKVPVVKGFELRDITVRSRLETGGLSDRVLQAFGVERFVVQGCEFDDIQDDALRLEFVIDGDISDVRFNGLNDVPENTPYGILAGEGCYDIRITNCHSNDGRHLFTTGGAFTEIACSNITIADCTAYGGQAPFDTHPVGQYITFINCHARNSSNNSPHSGGFQIRSRRTKVIGCTSYAGTFGFRLVQGSDNTIESCVAYNCDVAFERAYSPRSGFRDCVAITPITTGFRDGGFANVAQDPGDDGFIKRCNVTGNPSNAAFYFETYNSTISTSLADMETFDATTPYLGIPNNRLYGVFNPAGVKFETIPRSRCGANIISRFDGLMIVTGLELKRGTRISDLFLGVDIAPSSQANLVMGLYDPDGNLVCNTADNGTTVLASGGVRSLPVVTPVTLQKDGLYYFALGVNASEGYTLIADTAIDTVLSLVSPALAGRCAGDTAGTLPSVLPTIVGGESRNMFYAGVGEA